MSGDANVVQWAERILAKAHARAPAHQLLEVRPDASIEQVQDAFHKIARTSHPDLHRTTLTPEEHAIVTLAYSKVAGAYQDYRQQRLQTTRVAPTAASPATTGAPTATGAPGTGAPALMNQKATLYYRKAESLLRRGDLRGAVLQLKMAIAGDPQSAMLRSALAEVEAELKK